jgi:hypothetical protein
VDAEPKAGAKGDDGDSSEDLSVHGDVSGWDHPGGRTTDYQHCCGGQAFVKR